MKTFSLLILTGLLLCNAARAEAPPAPRCQYVQLARLPIRYVGPGLQPAIDGSIDGQPATLLVDTGAFWPYLTMTAVLRHDLKLQMSGGYVQGVGGISRVYSTVMDEFGVGPVRVRRMGMGVVRETGANPAYDGILAAPNLLGMDMELDLRAKQIRFFEARDCHHPTLRIWKEDTVSVPIDATVHNASDPHFTVLVNGKELDTIIDSGAPRSALFIGAAKRVGIDLGDPRVKKLPAGWGIGSHPMQRWSAPLTSVQIGGETIQNPTIEVIESRASRDPADLILGQDFLRAHRVLFAMSLGRLYLAYLGGDVFMPGTTSVDWVRQEAETGNADAQYVMAGLVGDGSPQGISWMQRAAAAGQPNANLVFAQRQMQTGQFAVAIPELRVGIAQLPANGYAPLWLYQARMRTGQPDLARSELEISLNKQKDDVWPWPVARFYLGQEDAAHVLAEAGDDAAHRCQAGRLMADWYRAKGDQAGADALHLDAACGAHEATP